MIRLTLAALAVTIALPALAEGYWTEPEKPGKEEPVKPDPKPEPEPEPEPETPEPETPEEPEPPKPEPEQPEPETPKPEPETPEPPGCPDCENPPRPQPEQPTPEPETPAEPTERPRFTPQSSDGETRLARVPPCCQRDGVIVAKRTIFSIGQGKAIEYCAKVDPATIPACEVKVTK